LKVDLVKIHLIVQFATVPYVRTVVLPIPINPINFVSKESLSKQHFTKLKPLILNLTVVSSQGIILKDIVICKHSILYCILKERLSRMMGWYSFRVKLNLVTMMSILWKKIKLNLHYWILSIDPILIFQ
jgi:hypothetical protein